MPLRLHRFELAEVEPRFGEHDAPIGIWGLDRLVGELGRRGAEGAQPSLRIQPRPHHAVAQGWRVELRGKNAGQAMRYQIALALTVPDSFGFDGTRSESN